ncbi:enoyl-CoA hydratase/isomerase family protein [Actinomadura barringtoniae]|uniref:Enoyl-CoA hydratase/isomerase family protein n=1 Tax=Actinomadura barringtoniae TaxID=1427535 RepID=A0A939PDR1_9ACTN|nr:enoyl-CoA hydratase/isomerase family protein [Actinomadura barringtoniae]MBO2447809.1 enoyl-CoA hydratase/isomerase family protein [Actinomadura barringtoniae]
MSITVTNDYEGRVARVTFDNSARGNCFDTALLLELTETLEAAADDPSCVVIRLDMAGRHFCGGWDTSAFEGLFGESAETVAERLRASDALVDRIRRLPVPVVAGVRGKVIGFGVGLLDAVHLPVAAADAQVSLPEARFGFAPAGVGHLIAQALPRAQAYALLCGLTSATGRRLEAWGLVSKVVPGAAELDKAVDEVVDGLLAVPGDTLRAIVDVVESSLRTGRPDRAYEASARTIVDAGHEGGES